MKTIKAIIDVTGTVSKKFNAHRQYVPFRNIFRWAGIIREPKILFNLLTQYGISGVAEEAVEVFCRNVTVGSPTDDIGHPVKVVKKSARKLRAYFSKVRRSDLKAFIRKKSEEVKLLLFPSSDMTTLHGVRKLIKEILLISPLIDLQDKSTLKFYGELQELIGQLHDKFIILKFLKSEMTGDQVILTIEQQCLSEKAKIDSLVVDQFVEKQHPLLPKAVEVNLPNTVRGIRG